MDFKPDLPIPWSPRPGRGPGRPLRLPCRHRGNLEPARHLARWTPRCRDPQPVVPEPVMAPLRQVLDPHAFVEERDSLIPGAFSSLVYRPPGGGEPRPGKASAKASVLIGGIEDRRHELVDFRWRGEGRWQARRLWVYRAGNWALVGTRGPQRASSEARSRSEHRARRARRPRAHPPRRLLPRGPHPRGPARGPVGTMGGYRWATHWSRRTGSSWASSSCSCSPLSLLVAVVVGFGGNGCCPSGGTHPIGTRVIWQESKTGQCRWATYLSGWNHPDHVHVVGESLIRADGESLVVSNLSLSTPAELRQRARTSKRAAHEAKRFCPGLIEGQR